MPWKPDPRFAGQTEFETDSGKAYGEMMLELDWSVGEILEALERNGFAENTLVIFSSDNGGALFYAQRNYAEREGHYANGPLRGQKTEVYEGGHRVPFIVRWPGVVAAGSESDALIANTDFMATVAEGLEVQLPEDQAPDSYSFLHVLTGAEPSSPVRDTLVMDAFTGLLAIRQGPWKYIPSQGGGGFGWRPYGVDYAKPPAQLYHLGNDIAERENLISQHPEIASRLHALLQELSQDQDTPADFLPDN